MYESFYNLKAEPFRLSPDHRFCFSHKSYAKAKAYMQYAIHRAEGFVMVTGKPGTGKTTLVNDLVDGLSHSKIVVATIVSTQLEADDLLRLVACNFGLDIDAPNKAVVLQSLSVRLRRYHEEGTRALLIIDEAQDLAASALEELRLLTNLQLNNQPLLQIFLVGQENLRELVQKPSMEQVHQRLVAACHLESLSEQDTKAYIRHRLDRVGWKDDPAIDEGVYPVVFQFSKGVPRRINLICSRFLLHGCVEEKHRIRSADVRTVVEELQHEQLAPSGFKSVLPPLLDDEVMETESDPVAEVDDISQPEPVIEQTIPEQRPSKETSGAQSAVPAPVSSVSISSTNNEILDLCSLEGEIRREESHPVVHPEKTTRDEIQDTYISLSEALDFPSEPIPTRKPRGPVPTEHGGYGDRFANAQRQKETGNVKTHYYNEYQAGADSPGVVTKKRSRLSLALIFLFIAVALSITIYVIRPALLQAQIVKLEERVGYFINSPREASTPGVAGLSSSKVQVDENGRSHVTAGSNQDATETVNTTGDVEHQSADQHPLRDAPNQQLSGNPAVDEQKKTAPAIELSSVSSFPSIPADSEKTLLESLPSPTTANDEEIPVAETEGPQLMAATDGPLPSEAVLPVSAQAPITDPDTSMPVESIANPVLANSGISLNGKSSAGQLTSSGELVRESNKAVTFPDQTSDNAAIPAEAEQATELQNDPENQERRILFDSNSTTIADEYLSMLSEVVDWLKIHTGHAVRIIGYADSRGDTDYNQELSLKRAIAVADYFEKHDIAESRLRIEGRGVYPATETPSNDQNSRQLQRFVEIVIIPTDG